MGRYSGKSCRLTFMIVLTTVFFIAEIIAGYTGNSISLVSDSFSMLSDLLSLIIGLISTRLSRHPPSGRYTYGLIRAEVVGALASTVFLAALCFSVSIEALKRIIQPDVIEDALLVLIVGALGLAVNIVGLFIFQDYSCCRSTPRRRRGSSEGHPQEIEQTDEERAEAGAPVLHGNNTGETTQEKEGQPLNIRGVLLHILNDALGSVVVVVTSTLFYLMPLKDKEKCNWQCYVDPGLTLVMVVIIMMSAAPLFKETIGILLQMSPADLPLRTILEQLSKVPGVEGVHEVHVWELARGQNVASLHVKCKDPSVYSAVSYRIQALFHEAGVQRVNVQPEFQEGPDPCLSPACQNGHLPMPPGDVALSLESKVIKDKLMDFPLQDTGRHMSTKF